METHPPYPCGSTNAVIFSTSAPRPYGLSSTAGFSIHWINSSICLLFCSVLTYSFIHNGKCIMVSGCLVIVIQLETERVLNKQKLVRLILFSFFQARSSLPIQLWNMNTKWLCDAPYHGFRADTMSPIIMALHSRLWSWAMCCHSKALCWCFQSCWCLQPIYPLSVLYPLMQASFTHYLLWGLIYEKLLHSLQSLIVRRNHITHLAPLECHDYSWAMSTNRRKRKV